MPFPVTPRLLALAVLASCTGVVVAMDEFVAGPRALALGGNDLAARVDDSAPQANPALLAMPSLYGRDKVHGDGAPVGWGLGTEIAGGAHQRNNLGGLSEALHSDAVQGIRRDGIRDPGDVRTLVDVASRLSGTKLQETALWGFADAGVSTRIGSFAVGALLHYEAAAYVANIDLTNLGTGVAGSAAATQINASGAPQDGTIGAMTTTQRDNLYTAFGGTGAFDPASSAGQAVLRLDFAMRQRGLTGQLASSVIAELQSAFSSTGATLDRNTSSAILGGFGVLSIPVSFGYRFAPWFSFGATVKALIGRVYFTRVRLFDDPEHALETIPDNYEQSVNLGVDLGGVLRYERFSLGVVGRDINEPTFKGPTVNGEHAADVRIDSQVTSTVAWDPWDSLLLLGSVDLLQATTVMPGYDQQLVSGGIEYEPWRALALRVGCYHNIAQNDVPYVLTGGIGTRVGPVRLDLAGAATLVTDTVLKQKVPREVGTSLGISATF
jgi:hypothetical protein